MRLLVVGLLVLVALFGATALAQAVGPVTLELKAPERLALGDEVVVTAVLRDGTGAPVPGATVIFYSPASFLSTGGAMELGRAATNARGEATFAYQARSQGAVTLNASFLGDSRYEAALASSTVTVEGSTQLYKETAGVRVPGIGVWLLVGILGGVWSTYLAVMVLLNLIARDAPKATHGIGGSGG